MTLRNTVLTNKLRDYVELIKYRNVLIFILSSEKRKKIEELQREWDTGV